MITDRERLANYRSVLRGVQYLNYEVDSVRCSLADARAGILAGGLEIAAGLIGINFARGKSSSVKLPTLLVSGIAVAKGLDTFRKASQEVTTTKRALRLIGEERARREGLSQKEIS